VKRVLLAVTLLMAGCGVQPSAPIPGSAATGALLYLVKDEATVTPVLRSTRHASTSTDALVLLVQGPAPAESALGYRTEVPPGVEPITVTGSTVTMSFDVSTLSTVAATQIVCTAAVSGPVTLRGGGQTRGPESCPV
jgi:hypothetical protein